MALCLRRLESRACAHVDSVKKGGTGVTTENLYRKTQVLRHAVAVIVSSGVPLVLGLLFLG